MFESAISMSSLSKKVVNQPVVAVIGSDLNPNTQRCDLNSVHKKDWEQAKRKFE